MQMVVDAGSRYLRKEQNWEPPAGAYMDIETDGHAGATPPDDSRSPKTARMRVVNFQESVTRYGPVGGPNYQLARVGGIGDPSARRPGCLPAAHYRGRAWSPGATPRLDGSRIVFHMATADSIEAILMANSHRLDSASARSWGPTSNADRSHAAQPIDFWAPGELE